MTTGTDNLAESLLDSGGKYPWFAIHVRVRREAAVSEFLTGFGYEAFLPLYKCRRVWSDRIREVATPLFPGYVFCRFNPHNRLPILKAPGVIQVVSNSKIPVPVDAGEIAAIQTVIKSGFSNQPWPFLSVGDRVRIESGPLRGIEGILSEFKGGQRLVVSISLLRRSVSVEMDPALIVGVKEPSARAVFRPLAVRV